MDEYDGFWVGNFSFFPVSLHGNGYGDGEHFEDLYGDGGACTAFLAGWGNPSNPGQGDGSGDGVTLYEDFEGDGNGLGDGWSQDCYDYVEG